MSIDFQVASCYNSSKRIVGPTTKALTYIEHGKFALLDKPTVESVRGENGKVDVSKLTPITYAPMNHHYLVLGKRIGQAFTMAWC